MRDRLLTLVVLGVLLAANALAGELDGGAPRGPQDWTRADREQAQRIFVEGAPLARALLIRKVADRTASNSFVSAVLPNLRAGRSSEYRTIEQRHVLYATLASLLRYAPALPEASRGIRFFDAAATVTSADTAGVLEQWPAMLVLSENDRPLRPRGTGSAETASTRASSISISRCCATCCWRRSIARRTHRRGGVGVGDRIRPVDGGRRAGGGRALSRRASAACRGTRSGRPAARDLRRERRRPAAAGAPPSLPGPTMGCGSRRADRHLLRPGRACRHRRGAGVHAAPHRRNRVRARDRRPAPAALQPAFDAASRTRFEGVVATSITSDR